MFRTQFICQSQKRSCICGCYHQIVVIIMTEGFLYTATNETSPYQHLHTLSNSIFLVCFYFCLIYFCFLLSSADVAHVAVALLFFHSVTYSAIPCQQQIHPGWMTFDQLVTHYGGNRTVAQHIVEAKRRENLWMPNPDIPDCREADMFYAPCLLINTFCSA